MKTFIIRSISGLVYVLLVIGSILLGKYAFVAVFGILSSYTLFEFYRLAQRGGNKPQTFLGIIISIYLFTSFFLFDYHIEKRSIFLGLIPMIILSPIVELFKESKNPVQNIAYTFLGIIYICLPFTSLLFIATPFDQNPNLFKPEALIGLFFIIWANDSGAYMFGSWLGKTKMIERISPNKSWEGAVGGVFVAIVIALVLFHFLDILEPLQVVILTVITVIAGTYGDLTESMIKRSFNVKDSGTILPGHGGLLDRFDSMLFAAPVYFAFISLILNN